MSATCACGPLTGKLPDAGQHEQLLNLCCRYLVSPQQLLGRTAEIYAIWPPDSYDLLELVDGRVFERISQIHYSDGQSMSWMTAGSCCCNAGSSRLWHLGPAGRLPGVDETAIQGAIRETQEEIGLVVEPTWPSSGIYSQPSAARWWSWLRGPHRRRPGPNDPGGDRGQSASGRTPCPGGHRAGHQPLGAPRTGCA